MNERECECASVWEQPVYGTYKKKDSFMDCLVVVRGQDGVPAAAPPRECGDRAQ